MREFGCPKWVRIQDEQCELGTRPCVFLGYASEAEVLWCNNKKASADMIDRDVTSDELASKANEQWKVAIAGPDCRNKKQGSSLEMQSSPVQMYLSSSRWRVRLTEKGGRP